LCNVFDNSKRELLLGNIGVGLLDLVGLLLGADSGYDRVAMLEQNVKNVGSDKARASSQKYAGHDDLCDWKVVGLVEDDGGERGNVEIYIVQRLQPPMIT
jgi:hypothetical protein